MQYFYSILAGFIFLHCAEENFVVGTSAELYQALRQPGREKIIFLRSGEYVLQPKMIIDSTCANCAQADTQIHATAGLILTGNKIFLTGPEDYSARIITNSGYGLYFLNCDSGVVKNLVISGGERDSSSAASDAAIVVKNSRVRIENNIIRDNTGDSLLVAKNIVGIIGIAGRENAVIEITGNRIIRNSWDGIALYRGARAVIENNLIDGVDRAPAARSAGGRGVGIGITWDARAVVRGNLVRNYWKGIGVFVNARAQLERNIIEDILTWGIAYWDAGNGMPLVKIRNNIIHNTGACGVSLASQNQPLPDGCLEENIIVRTAQNPRYDAPDYYCYQCALSLMAVPADFRIADNIFFANRRADESLPDYDLSRDQFYHKIPDYLDKFTGVKFLKETGFYRNYMQK